MIGSVSEEHPSIRVELVPIAPEIPRIEFARGGALLVCSISGEGLRDAATGPVSATSRRHLDHRDARLAPCRERLGGGHGGGQAAGGLVGPWKRRNWRCPSPAYSAPFRTRIALGEGASELVLAVHHPPAAEREGESRAASPGPRGGRPRPGDGRGCRSTTAGALAEAVRLEPAAIGDAARPRGSVRTRPATTTPTFRCAPGSTGPTPSGTSARSSAGGAWSEDEGRWLEGFVTNGFLVAEDLIEPDLLAQIRAELDDAAAKKIEGFEWGSSRAHREPAPAIPGHTHALDAP